MVTGSAVFIGLSLILVILIQWTDQGSFGMGHRQIGLIEVNGMILDPLPVVEQIQTLLQIPSADKICARIVPAAS